MRFQVRSGKWCSEMETPRYKVQAHSKEGFIARVFNPMTGKESNVRLWRQGEAGFVPPSKRTRNKANAAAPEAIQRWMVKQGLTAQPNTPAQRYTDGMTVSDFIEAAKGDPGVRGSLSPETRERRDNALNDFEAWLAQNGLPGFTAIQRIDAAIIEQWVAAKRVGGFLTAKGNPTKPFGNASLKRDLSVLKRAWNYLTKTQRLPLGTVNPCAAINITVYRSPQEKAIDRESRTMSDEDFETLLAACDEPYAPEVMRPLLMLCSGTGIRPGEARSALWQKLVQDEAGWTLTVKGKNGWRDVALMEETVEALQAWRERLKEWGIKTPYILCNLKGQAITKTAWAQQWRRFVRRAGLHGIRPYGMRHRAARKIVVNSGDLTLVQAQLGHANISTSELYTATTVRSASDRIRKALGGK